MATQFTACSACGAVGEIGKKCLFCGTTIVLKESVIPTDSRIVKCRTVTPQQYAEKISIYHNVKPFVNNLLMVSIGEQYGLVNMNGDIIYPLGNDEIIGSMASKDTIILGREIELTIREAYKEWDKRLERWVYHEAYTSTEFITKKYFNLETGMFANKHGLIEDKDNPGKLYRVDVKNGWKPINTYTNLKNEVHSYDYAEQVVMERDTAWDIYAGKREMYLLHRGNECSLWICYNKDIDGKYFDALKLSYEDKEAAMNGSHTSPMCVLEGIRKVYEFKLNNNKLQLALQTIENVDVLITFARKNDDHSKFFINHDISEIYKEWCIAIRKKQDGIYYNKFVLDKIKLLSDAISSNSSEEGCIYFCTTDYTDGLSIMNASTSYEDNIHNFTPQLMISFESIETEKSKKLLHRLSTCDDWELFESVPKDLNRETTSIHDRDYYILCGYSPENCCEILLRILIQVYDILPENAHNSMECDGGVFGGDEEDYNSEEEDCDTSNETMQVLVAKILILPLFAIAIFFIISALEFGDVSLFTGAIFVIVVGILCVKKALS